MKNQKEIEQLQQIKKVYETLLQVSTDGILFTDASRNIIEVNDIFCSFIGQNRKVVIESNLFMWLEVFSKDAVKNWIKLEKAVHLKQIVSNYEFQLLLNNEIKYFDVNASFLRKIENEKQGLIISSWHDITGRKKAEEALGKSEEHFRLITENTSDNIGITTFDLKAKYIYVNPSVKSILGYDPEDLLGKSFFDFIHPDDKKNLVPLLKKYVNLKIKKLLSGKETPITETIEFRFKNKAGNWRFMQSTINIVGKQLLSVTRDITESKEVEKALQESEKKYRLLAETSKDVIIVFDLKGNIKYINQEGINLSGYSEKEASKMNVKDVISEDKVLLSDKKISKRIAGDKRLFMYEIDFLNKKGGKIPVEIKSALITEQGKPSGVLLTARDITERKKMKEELIRLSNAFRMSSDSITLSDLEGKITDVNEATLKMFGTDNKADLIGKNSLDLLASEDKVKALASMNGLMKKGYSQDNMYNVILKDGSRIPVEMSTSIMKGMEGKPIGFVGITRDITERKQAEEALQESEKQLKTLIDTMPDFVCFKDGDGRWLMANEACIRIFRLENTNYRGKKDFELAKLNSHLRDSFLTCEESDAKVWKEGGFFHGEETIPDPDGSIRVYDVTKVPVSHSDGERKGLVILGHDITERKQAEEELKKHREHLEELIKERTAELEEKNEKLEYFNKLFVGREFRIKELRDRVKELEEKISDI